MVESLQISGTNTGVKKQAKQQPQSLPAAGMPKNAARTITKKQQQEEVKKPSDRLTKIKTADAFGQSAKKHKTNFGYAYAAGAIPCRINHGCNFNKLQWDVTISEVDYDPVLINCFEGLLETEHPYAFVAS